MKHHPLAVLLILSAMSGIAQGAITLRPNPTATEKKAAEELKSALDATGAGARAPDFVVGLDPALKAQEWRIRDIGGKVHLEGGDNRGVLYAVYHYLEDVCAFRFWNPHETHVPKLSGIPRVPREIRGVPAFENRDIYSVYGNDGGRFSARRRLNGDGNARIGEEYGGGTLFGPPYTCHTFNFYVPAAEYFKKHPEWFSEIDGKRTSGISPHNSQLCLSNKQLREHIKKRLREYIARGIADSAERGGAAPKIYDISQNDNQRYCRCAACDKIAEREGGQAGVMLDFINDIAKSIRADHPDILLSTFAYQYTENLPRTIRPDDNVMIVLCDTLSNASMPVTEKSNTYFWKLLKDWSEAARHIRIWDYAITFKEPRGLPYNSEWTYANDLRLFRERKVKQIFTELEEPVLADARDYKLYLRAKLTENPDADFDALKRDFACGFYGKCGDLFLEYRDLLKRSQDRRKPHINMFPPADAFTHLDLATVTAAHSLFDRGEKLLAGDEVRLKRWRHARLGLDRATLARKRQLIKEYSQKHGSFAGYPYTPESIIPRIRKAWDEQAAIRMNQKERTASLKAMEKEFSIYRKPVSPKTLCVPERFKNIPPARFFDFTADSADCYRSVFELVDTPEAESGASLRLGFPNRGGNDHRLEKYKLPIVIGIYSPALKKNIWAKAITANMLKEGFHWYNLGKCRLSSDALLFLTWSWYATFQVNSAFDPNNEDAEYDVWVCAKFTGKSYRGKDGEPDAIYFERLCLIRRDKPF